MRDNSENLFRIRASVSGDNVVLKISNLELWRPTCSVDKNHFCNFGRGHYEEQFCEFILNLGQWFRR